MGVYLCIHPVCKRPDDPVQYRTEATFINISTSNGSLGVLISKFLSLKILAVIYMIMMALNSRGFTRGFTNCLSSFFFILLLLLVMSDHDGRCGCST